MTISSLTPVEEKYSSVKQLIELGKEKGYLLYDEIYEMLPEEVVSLPDELDEIYIRFADLGVDVIDRPERYQNRDDFESGASEYDIIELAKVVISQRRLRAAFCCAEGGCLNQGVVRSEGG